MTYMFKDKLPLSTPYVYEIPCRCCYIGEIEKLVSTILKEHITLTKIRVLTEHSEIANNDILLEDTTF